ncbi:MAG TPA: beta-ketoacyl synthase N-terminal-like domain-containing protein [Micromonosporaceae bacterium]|nr:beta-ketoacyl synthase N-terminal-like domain-containing protein [Micromonosporaceae bacterium]
MVTDNNGTVITAWSAVSPFGLGPTAFEDGIRGGAGRAAGTVPDGWQVPEQNAYRVPDEALGHVLSRKGTRSMDRVTALAVATVGRLLDDRERHGAVATGESLGLVLGTTTGSAQSMMDFTRDSFLGAKPFFVDPARFPNTVMNCAAGQCAIWHRIKGPNATVAGGRIAGLHALNYARRLLRAGRAGAVLCGAVEELSRARCWLEWHSRDTGESGAVPGEGCAVLLVEPADAPPVAGRRPLADVLSVEFGTFTGDGATTALAACIGRAADRASTHPDTIWAVAPCGAPGAAGAHERAALDVVLGGRETVQVRPAELIGDTRAAAAAFQITAVLAVAADRPGVAGRLALVTAVDTEGVVGCALLRIRGQEE